MASKILFSSVLYDRFDRSMTLPAKFNKLLDSANLKDNFTGKLVAIKMHVGRGIGYSTIHPLFVKILVDKLKSLGANVYITDQDISGCRSRGYTQEYLNVPIVEVCGVTGKYVYPKTVDFNTLKNVDIGGNIYDADAMIVLSHVKGHGACGYGGACKNIAMGCVTDRTRQQIHGLEGGLVWDGDKCIHCDRCIESCNHYANSFNNDGKYSVNFHHCTMCQHCVKVCPSEAIALTEDKYEDFQTGMAVCTNEVLKHFKKESVYYINFLTNITAMCDCWGFTTPNLVPDIGVMASEDIVAIERACIDAIKNENLIMDGVPQGHLLKEEGHLFERLHGKNPYIQLDKLEGMGLGTSKYEIQEIF